MAMRIAPQGAVQADDIGFVLDVEGTEFSFFSAGGQPGAAYCRAKVAGLGGRALPARFAEAALKGSFFWRATEGAVLSWDAKENAVYLTDRFDDGAFEDDAALESYVSVFRKTLLDWRSRLAIHLEPVER